MNKMRQLIESIETAVNVGPRILSESEKINIKIEACRRDAVKARKVWMESKGTGDEEKCEEDFVKAKGKYDAAKGLKKSDDEKVLKELDDEEVMESRIARLIKAATRR